MFGKPGPEQLNNLINRQIAGVEYIILLLFTKSLYNQIHKKKKGLSCRSSIPEDSFKAGCVMQQDAGPD